MMKLQHIDHVAITVSDHGIAQTVYISDPDGHRIEITTYEV